MEGRSRLHNRPFPSLQIERAHLWGDFVGRNVDLRAAGPGVVFGEEQLGIPQGKSWILRLALVNH